MDFFLSLDGDDRLARQGDVRAIPEVYHSRKGWMPTPRLDLAREFAEIDRERARDFVDRPADLDA